MQLHGAVFTAWLLVFIAQTRLIAAHRVDLHMKLGIAAVVLATISVLTPAASRLLTLMGLREHWAYLVPIVPALFVGWRLAQDWPRHCIVHPVHAIGGVVVVAVWPLRLMIGPTEWRTHVGQGIARIGAGL
jgi:hypothetical protein